MKNAIIVAILTSGLLMYSHQKGQAQVNLKRKLEDIKQRVENKVNNKIDRKVDKEIDKVLDPTDGKPTGKDPKDSKSGQEKNAPVQAEKKDAGAPAEKGQAGSQTGPGQTKGEPDSLRTAYISKFDFIPGEKMLGLDGFESEAMGDFPKQWDTDASGEVVTLQGKPGKWLKLGKDGYFLPEFYKELPENFTLEFDVAVTDAYSWYSSPLGFLITTSEKTSTWRPDKSQWKSSGVLLNIHPVNVSSTMGITALKTFMDGKEVTNTDQSQSALTTVKGFKVKPTQVHVSVWKQGQRLRVYFNEKKYWDLPRAFAKDLVHNRFFFLTKQAKEDDFFFVSNFKLAAGTPDTRSRLVTEGSLTTNGITFDVNSDRLRQESFGVIRDIANVLNENPDIRVRIIGHTDSDGSAQVNQELSLNRARSVQKALVESFGIASSRLEVAGKGATEPMVANDSPLNKAMNRRVQFVKL